MGSWLINVFLRCKTEIMIETAKVKHWKVLNLSHQSLKEIPTSIFSTTATNDEPNLSNLKSLSLDHNNIKRLPLEFITFISIDLENLSLAKNRLESIPLTFSFSGAYKHLKFLNISDNDFSKSGFPLAICHCCGNLQHLWANGIQVKEIPSEIRLLKKLRTLGLRRNKLTSLPSSILELTDLSWLTLDQNWMKEIPLFIFQLKNLTHLNLNENFISTLPPRWFNLKALQYLYLRNNLLEISDNLIRDIQRSPNLKCADLTGNPKESREHFLGCITRQTPTPNITLETLWKNEVTLNEADVDSLPTVAGVNSYTTHVELPEHSNSSKLGLLHVSKKNKQSHQDQPQHQDQNKDNCAVKAAKDLESESQELTPADSSSTHLYIELHDVGTSTSRCIPLLTKRVIPNQDTIDCQSTIREKTTAEDCNLNKTSEQNIEDDEDESQRSPVETTAPPPNQKQLPTQTSLMAWTATELLEGGGSESHVTRRWEIRSNITNMTKARANGWEEGMNPSEQTDVDEIYLMNYSSTSSVSHDEFPYLENLPRPASIILLSQNQQQHTKERKEKEKERRDGSGEQQDEEQGNRHDGDADRITEVGSPEGRTHQRKSKNTRFRRSRNSQGLLNEFRVGLRPDENSVLEWGIHGNENDGEDEDDDETYNACGNSSSCEHGYIQENASSVSEEPTIYNDASHNDHNDNEDNDSDNDNGTDTVNSGTSLEGSISTDDLFSFYVLSNAYQTEQEHENDHHQLNLNFNETQLTDLDNI